MAVPPSLQHISPTLSTKNLIATATAKTSATTSSPQHPCLALLDTCSSISELKQIHAQLLRTGPFFDPFTASKIVAFSSLDRTGSGSLHYACTVFSQISNPTPFTYNSTIPGFSIKNLPHDAVLFCRQMLVDGLLPDRFTFPSLFKATEDLSLGKQLHCHSMKFGFASDACVQNTDVFDKMLNRNVVSWATMVGAHAQWDQPEKGIELFEMMWRLKT
ncbi:unnamed protein product [Citrullus colocynthis]|uniref:Pentatricopeptide repeat-containing protein n=1 Tax=Citrullus colocynthis TaxID=252529 RepID=A0ABP0Z1I6_9ROSI